MEILRIPAGVYAANCYIVYLKDSKDGLIIDPGGDVDYLIETIDNEEINLNYILLTHGHGDHIGGIPELLDRFNLPVYIHEDDKEMVEDGTINLSKTMVMGNIEIKDAKTFTDKDTLKLGDKDVKVIHTPGHTRGGSSFLIGNNVFTGDTLFKGSIGRTDLYGGNFDTIILSIKNKLMALSDDIIVYSGHGAPSTIGHERLSNPFIK